MLWILSPLAFSRALQISVIPFLAYMSNFSFSKGSFPVVFENAQISPIKIFFDITSPSNSLSLYLFPFIVKVIQGCYLCSTLFISLYLIHSLANPSLVSTSVLLPYQLPLRIPMSSVSLKHILPYFFLSLQHSVFPGALPSR